MNKAVVGVCAMSKKSQSKPMKEILTRLQVSIFIRCILFFMYILIVPFAKATRCFISNLMSLYCVKSIFRNLSLLRFMYFPRKSF